MALLDRLPFVKEGFLEGGFWHATPREELICLENWGVKFAEGLPSYSEQPTTQDGKFSAVCLWP